MLPKLLERMYDKVGTAESVNILSWEGQTTYWGIIFVHGVRVGCASNWLPNPDSLEKTFETDDLDVFMCNKGFYPTKFHNPPIWVSRDDNGEIIDWGFWDVVTDKGGW